MATAEPTRFTMVTDVRGTRGRITFLERWALMTNVQSNLIARDIEILAQRPVKRTKTVRGLE